MKKVYERGIVTQTDTYKIGGHFSMYPDDTTYIYSYFEARKGAKFKRTVFKSLQYIIKEYFVGRVVTQKMINNAEKLMAKHVGPEKSFNKKGWQYILDEYDGRLPLLIKAVPEGTAVDAGNVLFSVENTDPKCAWLTNYVESILSHVWYGSTVATLAFEVRQMLMEFLTLTCDDPEAVIGFMLHDFGYRGSTSVESAEVAGGAHLLSFMGTDNVPALEYLMEYYDGGIEGFSVWATEHSVMTAEGEEGEFKVVERLLREFPTGILSVVIDSYDWRRFIRMMGTVYKEQILARDGKFVFRPDSGAPVETTLEILEMLEKYFGVTINDKGYKVLNPKIGFLWGDGINMEGIRKIAQAALEAGWDVGSLVFGMGGALHQKVNRDTQRCAFKSSYQVAGGKGKMIFKDPLDSSKKSKKGKLALIRNEDGSYKTLEEVTGEVEGDLLVPIFKNGKLLIDYTFAEVKANLTKS